MTKLNEFMLQGSLFTEINNIVSIPFIPSVMDNLLVVRYGDKTMFSKLLLTPLNEVAKMIVALHGESWDQLIELQAVNFEVGASQTHKITETIVDTETRTNTRDDLNKVSAANSDELINNDGMTSTSNDGLNGEKIRTVTDSIIDINTAYENLSLSSKNRIIDLILKDVSNFLSLSIY